MIFPMQDVRDVGLYASILYRGFPGLGSGMTRAFFQSAGTWPARNNLLKIRRRASLLACERCSSIVLCMRAGSMALLVGRQRQGFSSLMLGVMLVPSSSVMGAVYGRVGLSVKCKAGEVP